MTYFPGGSPADVVPLGSMYNPIDDIIPASEVLTDALSTSNQSFTSMVAVQWDALTTKFNLQGQNWIQATPGNWLGGAKNDTSARSSGGVPYNMVNEFEFMHTGDKLEIMVIGQAAGWDIQVYVEYQGKMRKMRDKPLSSTTSGYVVRQLKFAATVDGAGGAVTRGGFKARRIRVVLGGNVNFLQLNVEASSLTYPSPARPMGILDASDSYWEPLHAQNPGSDETYFSYGLQQAFFEHTGIVLWNAAQGGTAFFQNGDSTARNDDGLSSVNSSRFGSATRKAKIAAGIAAGTADPLTGISYPLFIMGHGTINDGVFSGLGSGTANSANMKARAKTVFQEALAQDAARRMICVHVGPEPYTAIGAGTAGYVSGGPHDINRLAQIAAVSEVPRSYYIDASNPTAPWWTGNGSNNSSLTDQQALITGADNIHGNYRGYYNHARRIAQNMRWLPIPTLRATRQG